MNEVEDEVSMIFCIDISGSMEMNRLNFVKKAVKEKMADMMKPENKQ